MKKKIVFSIMVLSFLLNACGGGTRLMNPNARVDIGGPYTYSQEGVGLDRADMKVKLKENPASAKDVRASRGYGVASTIFSLTGGALTGIPLGQAASGQDANWVLAGVGAGMFLCLGLPFAVAADRRFRKAVLRHNESLRQFSLSPPRTIIPYLAAVPLEEGKGGTMVGGLTVKF